MPTVSILILTYNSSRFVTALLDSIEDKIGKFIEDGIYEVVVVDNNSYDDTVAVLRRHPLYKKIRFYESDSNLGYAKGINFASKKAKGEFLVIINPDSELQESDFSKAIEYFDDKKIGICGFLIKDYQDQPEYNAGRFYNILTFTLFSLGMESFFGLRFSPDCNTKVDYVSGGFMMVRADVFSELSGFDEKYFMYVEDMDLCYRAQKLGYDTHFLSFASIRHAGQGSSGKEFAIVNIYKGLVHFHSKNKGLVNVSYVRRLLRAKATLIIFIGTLLGKYDLVSTYKKALQAIK